MLYGIIKSLQFFFIPVSYTHLDVYKRQYTGSVRVYRLFSPQTTAEKALFLCGSWPVSYTHLICSIALSLICKSKGNTSWCSLFLEYAVSAFVASVTKACPFSFRYSSICARVADKSGQMCIRDRALAHQFRCRQGNNL